MTFIESLPLACSGQEASGQDRKSDTGCAWENSDTRRGDGGPLRGNLLALKCHLVGGGLKTGTKEGVHSVHTLCFGFGCTGVGLVRIGDVFGGGADLQGEEPCSSPTSGTVFSQVRGFLAFECAQFVL